ncbi:hypothetical protein C8R43DRAFT_1125831 [Mycena crocata]|nr:hypothetical protein C8R43DRAFT_1125831 [Mycena crocata]
MSKPAILDHDIRCTSAGYWTWLVANIRSRRYDGDLDDHFKTVPARILVELAVRDVSCYVKVQQFADSLRQLRCAHSLAGNLRGIQDSLAIRMVSGFNIADRVAFGATCTAHRAVAKVVTSRALSVLLSTFDLDSNRVRLLHAGTQTLLAGAAVTSVLLSRPFDARSPLAFYTAPGMGELATTYLARVGKYSGRIRRSVCADCIVWTLVKGGKLIRIIEGREAPELYVLNACTTTRDMAYFDGEALRHCYANLAETGFQSDRQVPPRADIGDRLHHDMYYLSVERLDDHCAHIKTLNKRRQRTRYFECSPPEFLLQVAFHDTWLRRKIRKYINSRNFKLDLPYSRTPFCVLPDADFDAVFNSFDVPTRMRLAAASRVLAHRAALFHHHALACAIGAWGLNLMEIRYLQIATHTLLAGYPVVATIHQEAPHAESFLDFFTTDRDERLVLDFISVTGGYAFPGPSEAFRDFTLWVGHKGNKRVRVFGSHIEPERLILRGAPSSSHMVFCDVSRLLCPYGDLTLARIDLVTPKRFPIEASFQGHLDTWAFVKEIERNGFAWQTTPGGAHNCGSDFSCPCTPRRLDDKGVLMIRMPTLDILFGSLLRSRTLKRSWVFYGAGCSDDVEPAEDDEQWENTLIALELMDIGPVSYREYNV